MSAIASDLIGTITPRHAHGGVVGGELKSSDGSAMSSSDSPINNPSNEPDPLASLAEQQKQIRAGMQGAVVVKGRERESGR